MDKKKIPPKQIVKRAVDGNNKKLHVPVIPAASLSPGKKSRAPKLSPKLNTLAPNTSNSSNNINIHKTASECRTPGKNTVPPKSILNSKNAKRTSASGASGNKIIRKVTGEVAPCATNSRLGKNNIQKTETVKSDLNEKYELLQTILPQAQPSYVKLLCRQYSQQPEVLNSIVSDALDEEGFLTAPEINTNRILERATEFDTEKFVNHFPNPVATLTDPTRVIKMDAKSMYYAKVFLQNKFNQLPLVTINNTFHKNKYKLFLTVMELRQIENRGEQLLKCGRRLISLPPQPNNIALLQEINYIRNEELINNYILNLNNEKNHKIVLTKMSGLLKVCGCCYDENVLPEDCFSCQKNCKVCRSCMIKNCEVRFGEGKLDFPCLLNCSGHYSLKTLEMALPERFYSQLINKKAVAEIKSANIRGLESCPFCDFAAIIPSNTGKVFHCLNPECMKDSCRKCHEPAHGILCCYEREKDENIQTRVFIENKMTEALLRTCWKCGINFFKEQGCNHMTCSCGAHMCYICSKPVSNYDHFNGLGGENYDRCPLFSDTISLNETNILNAANAAKKEMGVDTDPQKLKIDPSLDIKQYFKEKKEKLPKETYFHLL